MQAEEASGDMHGSNPKAVRFPKGAKFAFTVFDDTDKGTVANVGPVYDLLSKCGILTTKSVWPLSATRKAGLPGQTLAEPDYLELILALKEKGFEIGLHNVSPHGAYTDEIETGLARFRELIGQYPRTHANHLSNEDNIYWGPARLTNRMCRWIYRLATMRSSRKFYGEVETSRHFWGDLCKENVTYVRNFTFREINLLNINPTMPYHDPARPYVKYWFSSTWAPTAEAFREAICEDSQQKLEDEGGICIVYTHFANGFVKGDAVDPEFGRLMEMMGRRNGWFVPVGELLDYLLAEGHGGTIPRRELRHMERKWLWEKIRSRIG